MLLRYFAFLLWLASDKKKSDVIKGQEVLFFVGHGSARKCCPSSNSYGDGLRRLFSRSGKHKQMRLEQRGSQHGFEYIVLPFRKHKDTCHEDNQRI